MNIKYTQILYVFFIAFIAVSLVSARNHRKNKIPYAALTSLDLSSITDATVTDPGDIVPSITSSGVVDATEKQLSEVYNKMGGVTDGMLMNLDSSFGGGRCNCVCEDNN